MRKPLIVRTFLAAAAALLFLGCSSSNSGAPPFNPTTGQHPAGWTQNHYAAYLANPASCTPCHGSAVDPAAAGGTSQVSCFGCHHPNGPNHPAGWAASAQHGRLGAQAPANAADFSMQGMASCAVCHGADYRTGVGVTQSCTSCHTKAPHPDAPWLSSTPATSVSHDQTDASNAPACFTCHQAGSATNTALGITLTTPAAGAAPGCFNNTMCHGTNL